MTFKDLNLNASLLHALDDMGYTTPTTIQLKAFSVIMSGRDVCGIAQTGTGKTFAYLLPCLRMWKYSKDRYPQILILVPTRELVVQVTEEVRKLSKYLTLEVLGVYGGVNMKPQAAAAQQGTDVVVATPGRLLDLIYDGAVRTKSLRQLVIDEVDEMFDLGFRTQLNNILDLLPTKRQNLMFSATITPEVSVLLQSYFNDPQTIEAAPTGTPLENVEQTIYHTPNFHTKANLVELLLTQKTELTKVLIFVATKSLADQLFDRLEPEFGAAAGVIHSNKSQVNRLETVRRFQDGTYRFVIATDIVARGLDIASVSHVINFDMPEVREDYIHRIGRTGRAEKKGISITLVTEKEQENLKVVEAFMNYQIPVVPLPEDLEISDVLTEDEMPVVRMKETLIKLPKLGEGGAAFHEKAAKNKRVNVKIKYADKMKAKYKSPLKRKPKKK